MAENTPPIQVYIENANDASIGGFTIPLPTTREALAPWFAAIEVDGIDPKDIVIKDVRSGVIPIKSALGVALTIYATLDELNYLAAKINGLSDWQTNLYIAAIEADRYCGSVKDLINLEENINRFDLVPAYNAEQYGEAQIQMGKDNTADAFERLEKSENAEDRELAQYILQLEAYVDEEAFGRGVAKEENGVFTEQGCLVEHGEFREVYHSKEDIPKEYRIFPREEPLLKAADVDLAQFLVKLHALAGDYSHDVSHNLETLKRLRSTDYLLLLDGKSAYLTESAHAYRRGTTAFDMWMSASGEQDTKAFAIHLTEVHSRLAGDVYQIDVTEQQKDILNHSVQPIRIDAVLGNGDTRTYMPDEWNALSLLERDRVQNYNRVFKDEDYTNIRRHIENNQKEYVTAGKPVGEDALLINLNNAYLEQARNPIDGYLRVTQDAAKELLARGDADIYRLLPTGAEKLSQIDAVKTGLWYSEFREFAVRREDMPKLDSWAMRSAGDILKRSQERNEQKISHEPEV